MRELFKGVTSYSQYVVLRDSTTGLGKTGLIHSDITGSYTRSQGSRTAITMATLAAANSAWSSGGFKEVDGTNCPGLYRFDVPDAAFATGAPSVIVSLKATGVITEHLEVLLVDWNKQVAAIPNAAAAASGGLPTVDSSNAVKVQSGTGANQISLSSGLVTAGTVATGAITSGSFASGAINAAAIATDAITSAKIAADAIGASEIADGAIDAATFASGAITAAAIAADAIGASELAADAVTEIQSGLATAANQSTILTNIAAVQADTDDIQTRLPAALVGGRIDSSVGAYQSGQAPLQPTVAGRTLDVTTTGEAGIDWANIGGPTTSVNLSGTTVGTATAVTGVSSGGITSSSFASGAINAAAIAPDAIGASELASDAVAEIQSGLATAANQSTILTNQANIEADTQDIQGRLPAALVSGRMDASVGAMQTDTLTSAALASSAVTEIQSGLGTSANQSTIIAGLVAVNADTDDIQTRLPASLVGGRIDASVGAAQANTLTASALATDAVTEIQAAIAAGSIASVTALGAQAKADVNAEILDVLTVDASSELSGVPAANCSLADKIRWLFLLARNKITQTSSTQAVRNDADAANVASASVADDGSTFVRGEWS